jgi:hypothetical protein
MPTWLITTLSTAGSVVLTLTVTLLFNKLVALPRIRREQREAAEAETLAREEAIRTAAEAREEELQEEIDDLRNAFQTEILELRRANELKDARIAALQAAVDALPSYRAQSLQIQTQLQTTDREILAACEAIQRGVADNQRILNERLDRLESREKNAIRQKLLDEHRLFTNKERNPMKAWTEMEQHAFFKLVKDYEDLGGNDYVHSQVLPDMNRLEVVRMDNLERLAELMASRTI